MNTDDFKKLIKQYSEEDITADEPHLGMRCVENNITFDQIKDILLSDNYPLIRIIEDRPQVYKLYFQLSRKTELKVVVDFFAYKKINIRTIKRLTYKFRLGTIQRRRF